MGIMYEIEILESVDYNSTLTFRNAFRNNKLINDLLRDRKIEIKDHYIEFPEAVNRGFISHKWIPILRKLTRRHRKPFTIMFKLDFFGDPIKEEENWGWRVFQDGNFIKIIQKWIEKPQLVCKEDEIIVNVDGEEIEFNQSEKNNEIFTRYTSTTKKYQTQAFIDKLIDEVDKYIGAKHEKYAIDEDFNLTIGYDLYEIHY